MESVTQKDIIIEYFKKNQNKDISHPEVVDWATEEYQKRTGNRFRDPDRQIRQLHQSGFLIKVSKGIYRYDPDYVIEKYLEDFSSQQKDEILKRDGYKCVICGKGINDGVELHIDHIKPKDLGGKATIENGQTLCAQHNFIKKNLKQTETGKKMFIRLYELAKIEKNIELLEFCKNILTVYEDFDMNGHIIWNK
jgi:predicted restriction endonuclease